MRIGAHEPLRLDRALTKFLPSELGISRTRIAQLVKSGQVYLQGKAVTTPSVTVLEGQVYDICLPQVQRTSIVPESIPLNIVYEDAEILVIDKPAGMVVHPGAGNPNHTLVNALIHHCGDNLAGVRGQMRPGIVHRLDKDTSGLLVVAKSDRAMYSLTRQFAAKTARRTYFAIVQGHPTKESLLRKNLTIAFEENEMVRIETMFGRHPHNRLKFKVLQDAGKLAITRFRVLSSFMEDRLSTVECQLETGRTHQIRVHMEYVGHPVLGDRVYGRHMLLQSNTDDSAIRELQAFPYQALRAVGLEFKHPITGEIMRFQLPLTEDLSNLLEIMKNGRD